jgi:hypothetical protein
VAHFKLFAQPWWVNVLILMPILAWLSWRRKGLLLPWSRLLFAATFAVAFGFIEAAVVIYLRAATSLLPGYGGTLADVARLSSRVYQQPPTVVELPRALLVVEVFREAATMVVLLSVALLTARRLRERWALFLWEFAIWDLCYYAGLWATIRWPYSLLNDDVLFLIPVPWLSQIWLPLLVSGLTVVAVLLGRQATPAMLPAPSAECSKARYNAPAER